MHPELHAAIVGGILSGVVVFAAIAAEHRLSVYRNNREELERSTLRLAMVLPHVTAGMMADYSLSTDLGSDWSQKREEALTLMARIRLLARGRRRRRIRKAVERLIARTTAAEFGFLTKRAHLPREHALALTTEDLFAAVFGDHETLDRLITHYLEHGLEPPPPEPFVY